MLGLPVLMLMYLACMHGVPRQKDNVMGNDAMNGGWLELPPPALVHS